MCLPIFFLFASAFHVSFFFTFLSRARDLWPLDSRSLTMSNYNNYLLKL